MVIIMRTMMIIIRPTGVVEVIIWSLGVMVNRPGVAGAVL